MVTDPPWTGMTPKRVRSGNNKDKMTALEAAYDNLKQKTPDVWGNQHTTRIDIIRAASLHTDSLEEQLKQALAAQPGSAAAGVLPTQLPCPMPSWEVPTKVQGKLWTPPAARQPNAAWKWPPTIQWPVQVWEGPLPATTTGSTVASATQARTSPGGDKATEGQGVSLADASQPTDRTQPIFSHGRISSSALRNRRPPYQIRVPCLAYNHLDRRTEFRGQDSFSP